MEPRPGLVPPHDSESGAIPAEEDLKCREGLSTILKRLTSIFLRKSKSPQNPTLSLLRATPPSRPPEYRKKRRTQSYDEDIDRELLYPHAPTPVCLFSFTPCLGYHFQFDNIIVYCFLISSITDLLSLRLYWTYPFSILSTLLFSSYTNSTTRFPLMKSPAFSVVWHQNCSLHFSQRFCFSKRLYP